MSTWTALLLTTLALAVRILGGIASEAIAGEIVGWVPRLSKKLIDRASLWLSFSDRDDFVDEMSDIIAGHAENGRPLTTLFVAAGALLDTRSSFISSERYYLPISLMDGGSLDVVRPMSVEDSTTVALDSETVRTLARKEALIEGATDLVATRVAILTTLELGKLGTEDEVRDVVLLHYQQMMMRYELAVGARLAKNGLGDR